MAVTIKTNANGTIRQRGGTTSPIAARDTDNTSKRIRYSVNIILYEAIITVRLPAGSTRLFVQGDARYSTSYDVTGVDQFTFSVHRVAPTLTEDPKVKIALKVNGGKSTTLTLNFVRLSDIPIDPNPVEIITNSVMSSTGVEGAVVQTTPAVAGGGVISTETFIEKATTENGTYTSVGSVWTTVPTGFTEHWFRFVTRFLGPDPENPGNNIWTRNVTSPSIQITAPAEAQLTTNDITIDRTEYRPGAQTTYFTPIVQFPGLVGETVNSIQFTAADTGNTNPTWHTVTAKSGESGSYELFDNGHPVANPAQDAGLFVNGSARLSRLRFRWRQFGTQPYSPASPTFTIAAPPDDIFDDDPATYTVTTTAGLETAMTSATGTQVIAVAAGTYANWSHTNVKKPGAQIRIRPVDRNTPPVFLNSTVNLNGCEGFILDGLIFRNTVKDTQGYPAGDTGMTLHGVKDFTIRNCLFEGFFSTIYILGSENFTFEYNELRGCGMDDLRLYAHHVNPTIRNNYAHSPDIDYSRAGIAGRHPDFLQFAVRYQNNEYGVWGGVIENNHIETGLGYKQCIFMFNEWCAGAVPTHIPNEATRASVAVRGHRDITVRGNFISSRHVHAIVICATDGILVENNVIRNFGLPAAALPGGGNADISVIHVGSTGIVRNNVKPVGSSAEVALINSGDASGLEISGIIRNNTAVPTGFTMPVAGRYAYL